MLPLIIAAGAAGLIYKVAKSESNDAKSDSLNIEAFNRESEAEYELFLKRNKTTDSLKKLAKRKQSILNRPMAQFISLVGTIKKINFDETDAIKEILEQKFTPEMLKETTDSIDVSGYSFSDGELFGTFLFGGITGIMMKESEINLKLAEMRNKQSLVVEQQSKSICTILDTIYQRSEQISELLAKMNFIFMKSLKEVSEIISVNGLDKSAYTIADKDCIASCMNFAYAIKKVVVAPLFNQEGELAEQSVQALKIGNEYLSKIGHVIENSIH